MAGAKEFEVLKLAALLVASAAATTAVASSTDTLVSSSPWWEKVTVTMDGNGKPEGCRYETSLKPADAFCAQRIFAGTIDGKMWALDANSGKPCPDFGTGGVVNLLTGFRKELVPTFATHTHLRALSAVATPEERKTLELGAAESVKRTRIAAAPGGDWFADGAQSLQAIRDFLEFKTTWHPIGA